MKIINWIKEKYWMWQYYKTRKQMLKGIIRYAPLKLAQLRFRADRQFEEDERFYKLLKFATELNKESNNG
jgi:hypothetical protein